ncbi:class Ib ribonucleoside-diphosphate reductase assembly flavoprotein NrdI [Corynebacterium afermentans subsp. lipophilum]|uniref:class Ib ribonucleoside-diphosphate reductase assembly flavoprotein NrdI n=1 Tax=Corynebacterium afermentans TaxID=38286 RepID=UPI00188AFC00|nr:class Ib ribonucleoside-diphosphate reductase assembly flavoprotein NrdI [Corynebacterium afermentans]MBF4547161.1 class Ib ribonucleoside-diphosphate reductase assembly flavoprotein NrdI [Corynebacterium afermentans subsp. lipophilum]WJY59525.1 Putative NrdI-like protein [Corynebacterium afermentans subsp. lipophilum]
MLVVYFSSATENTKRFVEKLGLPSQRIPLRRNDPELNVDEPYVLICPTYGGGVSVTGGNSRPVPGQVIRFLNNEGNRSLIRGVIAAGNSNFGADYCLAGKVIADKCKVPYLYRFELMGSAEDVAHVRRQLVQNAGRLGLRGGPEVVDRQDAPDESERLAKLREKYAGKYSRTR